MCVGRGDNLLPVKSIFTTSPGTAGLFVLLRSIISKSIFVVGTNAKFTLYHIGFATKFCAGAVCGVHDKLLFGVLNCGLV